jgi:hypothetical protein
MNLQKGQKFHPSIKKFYKAFAIALLSGILVFVPPRGFEPPTNGLGNRCSIHTELRGQVNNQHLVRSLEIVVSVFKNNQLSCYLKDYHPTVFPRFSIVKLKPGGYGLYAYLFLTVQDTAFYAIPGTTVYAILAIEKFHGLSRYLVIL